MTQYRKMNLSYYSLAKRRLGTNFWSQRLPRLLDLVLKFPCSADALDLHLHNYRPLPLQSTGLRILEILSFMSIFKVYKSDKTILEVLSSKCE